MIYSLTGTLKAKGDGFSVIDVGGLGFTIHMTQRAVAHLPVIGGELTCLTALYVKEDSITLYGFEDKHERTMFTLLTSVSSVGPKSALSILDVADVTKLNAAIREGRADLLARASGIGKKTAERIVVELRERVGKESSSVLETMEGDADLEDALVNLGYRRQDARDALAKVDRSVTELEDRLKEALTRLRT